MKLFAAYMRQRTKAIAAWALFCAVFAATFALYQLPLDAVLYPALLCTLFGGLFCVADYARVRRRHAQLQALQAQAAALAEQAALLPPADTVTEAGYHALVAELQKQLTAQQTAAAVRYRDMVDYYTVWAHQIKTPIAAMRLNLQNEDTPFSRRLAADLFRIEQYVEMVLAFLRLDSPESDYVFAPHALDDILAEGAKKFAGSFIQKRIRLQYEPTGLTLITDEKWLGFVVEQLLSNALKYTPEGGCITIGLQGPKTLAITDTGIGIAPNDLPRIFEKGYTGYNGRQEGHASGLGLYLCRRVCQNLGLGITAQSAPGQGTAMLLDLRQQDGRKE